MYYWLLYINQFCGFFPFQSENALNSSHSDPTPFSLQFVLSLWTFPISSVSRVQVEKIFENLLYHTLLLVKDTVPFVLLTSVLC